ncbi:MAG: hypothetical protein JNK48_15610 [Bryobacterales bacterium]|nr:hypothetical protein [Bryobacterales bacterium]
MFRQSMTLGVLAGLGAFFTLSAIPDAAPNTGMADPAGLLRLYNQYRAARPSGTTVQIGLTGLGNLSQTAPAAFGMLRADLASGAVRSQLRGMPEGAYELWLADNRASAGATALADSSDTILRAGAYRATPDGLLLDASLTREQLSGFELDRAYVTPAGQHPSMGFVLTGAANFYERLARGYVRNPENTAIAVETENDVWALVAAGRNIFLRERFNGNGRTCSSCHVESNNFTVDPAFLATLPASDPVFIHERNSDLKELENPDLLRKLGVFVANADGFDDPRNKFTLRPAPSLQGLALQSTPPEPVLVADFTAIGAAADTPERLGWSNDALPLRDFAIGAIVQHMPKSLNRRAGTDFRLPTDEELDAMAAFQLSLGRSEEFDLTRLKLFNPQAIAGQKLYLDTGNIGEPGHKNCNACHFNGGGTGAFAFNPDAPGFTPKLDGLPRGFNVSTGTNVNALPIALQLKLPRDGGFGAIPLPGGGFGNFGFIPDVGSFPVEEFTSNSIIEAADTAPYFHNHTVATLEESIAFYGSPAYQAVESIGDKIAGPVPVKISDDPSDPEVQAIATFLRVLNALENIRSAVSATERARRVVRAEDAREIALLAREEAKDAFEVLSSGSLSRAADFTITLARARLVAAATALQENNLERALTSLRGAREVLADTATLPAGYRQ